MNGPGETLKPGPQTETHEAMTALPPDVANTAAWALNEDAPSGDITARNFIPAGTQLDASVRAREGGIMAGGPVLAAVMAEAARREGLGEVHVEQAVAEGAEFEPGYELMTVKGPARAVLLGERVGLNLLQRLSAIATKTSVYVAAANEGRARGGVEGKVRVADTRKTTPGLRSLERYAVRCGGGFNHRWGLSDAVMLKDNHVALLGEGTHLTDALRAGAARLGHTTHIEVEVDRPEQIEPVLAAGVGTIMLDNFTLDQLRAGVQRAAGRALVEASGNVNLETIADIAATGVDVISVGSLTHGVVNLDVGLDAVFG